MVIFLSIELQAEIWDVGIDSMNHFQRTNQHYQKHFLNHLLFLTKQNQCHSQCCVPCQSNHGLCIQNMAAFRSSDFRSVEQGCIELMRTEQTIKYQKMTNLRRHKNEDVWWKSNGTIKSNGPHLSSECTTCSFMHLFSQVKTD